VKRLKLKRKSRARKDGPLVGAALENHICERVANGVPLAKLAKLDGMPKLTDIFAMLAENKEFYMRYQAARTINAHRLFDETIDIADKPLLGETYEDEKGRVRVNWEAVARSKLRIETRQYIAEKLAPEIYGSKIQGSLDLHHMTSFDDLARKALEEEK